MARVKNSIQQNNTSVNRAFENLRLAITSGFLLPKQQVVEVEVAKNLGISRTPVREAMRQLEIYGYLTKLPNLRMVVSDRTPEQLMNYYEIREALEVLAVKLTCKRASSREIGQIVKYNNLCNRVIDAREKTRFYIANTDLHKQIMVSSHNEELVLQVEKYWWFNWRIPYSFTPKDWRTIQKQHNIIVDALCKRNENKAISAIHKHIKSAINLGVGN